MEETRKHERLLQRSEEIQDIVDRMPVKGATYTAYVVIALVAITFTLGCVISYPDTVDGRISLTAGLAPVRLVAHTSGNLIFYKEDRTTIRTGEVIASLAHAASLEKVLALEKRLQQAFSPEEYEEIDEYSGYMGELSNAFQLYLAAFNSYRLHKMSKLYDMQIAQLRAQIASDTNILQQTESNGEIAQELVTMSRNELRRDSLLLVHKAITEETYLQRRVEYLTRIENALSAENERTAIAARIESNRTEIERTRTEQQEKEMQLHHLLQTQRDNLLDQIALWKENYLLTAPVDGKVEYLEFWRNHRFVQAGKEVVSIIPERQTLFGEVRIPTTGMGKVKVGQQVNVKIDNYPYDEYGLIKGEVKSVSRIPSLYQAGEGHVDSYLALITFPEGAVTNYGIALDIDFESKGTAEIITEKKKLIERLFDNLKSKMEK